MKKSKHLFLVLAGGIIFLFACFSGASQDRPTTGYWAMEGTLVTHHFKQEDDSLSGPELFELQDENGLPVWFGRHIFKDVCISGVCKMIRLWLFWDGAGNYLGIQVPENEPLTKSDHTEFEPDDYKKLEGILRDTRSILKDLEQEDLIIVPDTIGLYEVDGYTAATQPTLAEAVVKDAVYTCYTLWHTVYGPMQTRIYQMLENRLSKEYLEKMFNSEKPDYILRAIRTVDRHPEFHQDFYQKIMKFIASEDEIVAREALKYFKPGYLDNIMIQQELADIMIHSSSHIRNEILWMFIDHQEMDDRVVLKLLKLFDDEVLGIGQYNLILKLVRAEHLKNNEEISKILQTFLSHENAYVRGLTKRLLDE